MPRSGWIDISTPLENDMAVWPGDPPTLISRSQALARGDEVNLTALSMCAHAGTHIDAPLHYFADGASIDRLPFDATVGPARVIAIRSRRSIRLDELHRLRIRRGERILFRTRNSEREPSAEDYVPLDRNAATFLVSGGVRCVGIDALSIGPAGEEGDDVHQMLLGAGVWIIEGLRLAAVKQGRYDLICLPLSIPGADGAPASAILRRR